MTTSANDTDTVLVYGANDVPAEPRPHLHCTRCDERIVFRLPMDAMAWVIMQRDVSARHVACVPATARPSTPEPVMDVNEVLETLTRNDPQAVNHMIAAVDALRAGHRSLAQMQALLTAVYHGQLQCEADNLADGR